jgi:hypothetical protein
LARSTPVSNLGIRHVVNRKFVIQQTSDALVTLNDAGLSTTPESEMLFELMVTKTSLRQIVVAFALICRNPFRCVIECTHDLLGVSMSVRPSHEMPQSVAQKVDFTNHEQGLSAIQVALHNTPFQGAMPVLTGIEAQSTYYYPLAAPDRHDADSLGVHLLDATRQGLKPDDTIADARHGLRAGSKAGWDDTHCHGDVFHIKDKYRPQPRWRGAGLMRPAGSFFRNGH